MGYPDTTDAFAVTDLKKWSEFTRKDVCALSIIYT